MTPEQQALFGDEPVRHVQRDGVDYALLGTAHVSRTSAEAVERLLASGHYDAVAVELCPSRYQTLTERDAWRNMDLFRIIREGKAGMMMASLTLSAYQRRIAEQFGIEPGAEMKAAIEAAGRAGIPVQLIDREIGITLRRASRRLSWWKRWLMLNGLVMSMFSRQEISEEDIERLKQGDLLTETFSEFSETAPELYESLITERDRFMAARLRQENESGESRRVLAVLGAGHLEGTAEALGSDDDPEPTVSELNHMPPPSRFIKALPWLIAALVITGFAIGFSRSPELGLALIATWVIINGTLSALGALIAGGHPLTVLTALVAAPLTSLNPTIGAGMVTGAVEAWLRKPRVADFESLRDDVVKLSGWWRNRVSRVLLVFFLSNLGSAIGTWVAGFRMVQQLT
ncbi:TraB/GumN family protein [Wenzhouxiangella sp. XN201]|uniref:TraB/GumN family protein n=1 Tax=Wenzhouxiangella sp. XN201 TaxID=2710755 RepID=UPI0013C93997|nr:TraB/GumN family protein [Wenzhouxiangella sp. XN201]NEZ04066.1 TraB/GumN family protein [Wenzhouxiangella sp. XN201]